MGKKHKYAVVLDAGSSGTRAYVYQYIRADFVKDKHDEEKLSRLPKITEKDHHKVHPGISTFGDSPELVGPDHLEELITFAKDVVPKNEIEHTPIFLLATAGVRLLPKHQQTELLEKTCSYFQEHSKFQLPDCDLHIQVIPGETEGLYGWLAANYLLGAFDAPEEHKHGKNQHTYGFLDMGGASAQIAFAPSAAEAKKHADHLKLVRLRKVNGEPVEHGVFVTTWLEFGANEARRRYVEHLLAAHSGEHEIPDPCLPVGLLIDQLGAEIDIASPEILAKEPHLIGTGQFTECLASTFPLLQKNKACEEEPCLLNGVFTPKIDFDVNHFVGVSNFWHTTHEIFAMAHEDRAYDFHTYQKQVKELCSREWKDIEEDIAQKKWGKKVDEATVEEVCFKASWLINMLHDGIGVPRVGIDQVNEPGSGHGNKTSAVIDEGEGRGFLDPFQAVDEIDGMEVSWTLGKMVLYASSQMPPAEGTLAVGFGSNIPGSKELPADFQFPSGQPSKFLTETSTATSEDADGQDWHDRILSSSYSRRIPGILIFLLIIALAVYLICGRERRTNLWNKVTGRSSASAKRRKGGPVSSLSSKLFGNNEPSYERVLEDASDPTDFELASVLSDSRYSDSSNDGQPPRQGRTSGWATPSGSARGMSPDITRNSPTKSKYDVNGTSSNLGLGITPFERGGLSVRAESRERLAPTPSTLGRTRTGSPRRSPLVPPLSPFKENVD